MGHAASVDRMTTRLARPQEPFTPPSPRRGRSGEPAPKTKIAPVQAEPVTAARTRKGRLVPAWPRRFPCRLIPVGRTPGFIGPSDPVTLCDRDRDAVARQNYRRKLIVRAGPSRSTARRGRSSMARGSPDAATTRPTRAQAAAKITAVKA